MSLVRRLASRSILIFAARLLGAGLIFVLQIAIARLWGAAVLGDFILAIAAASILAVVIPLGYQTVGAYFTALYSSRSDGHMLRRFLVQSYGHVLVVGTLVVALGWVGTFPMGETGAHLRSVWTPTALIALSSAVLYVNSTTLIGMKQPFLGYGADMLVRPIVMLGLFAVVILLTDGAQLSLLLWLIAGGTTAICIVHLGVMAQFVRTVPRAEPRRPAEFGLWWRFAAPWVFITLASDYFFDLNLLMLAGLLDRTDLAVFGVSTRIFALVSFGIVTVYSLTLPDMFEADRASDTTAFGRRVGEANLVATLLAFGLFAGVALFGRYALALFGDEFVAGSGPLSILCLALVVRAMFGPASLVLSMHDQPAASLPAVGLGILALVAGNYLLVPQHGLMGAAVSAFTAITLWSFALWFTALRRAKVDVSLLARFRARAAA
ncbi:lipopolysaccharide biosynthesis protein [Pelagibacterium montanilacus]|uniref:lipopolysaccharide biosynthesis protein n=1 Tax=Pelagibacterium montanilacus TaxID=2185280 RepID=UPI000F8C6768|nr:polysaccharide biosynthesis C-terminal domain-containing protein [Pelagibacterium montanilacus]